MRNYRLPTIVITLFLSACSATSPRDQANTTTPPEYTTDNGTPGEESNSVASITDSDKEVTPSGEQANVEITDIWERIRLNLTISRNLSQNSITQKLAWYARNQEFLDRVADRATPYIHYIIEQLDRRHMPLDLALLPIVESAYHPFALSPSRASGIWQFIPSTGSRYGLKQNWWYDGRRDIIAATDAALDYLQKLHQEFNGDWLLALAAYNAGELNVSRAIDQNRKAGKPVDFWSLKLPRETRGYVPSFLAVAEIVSDPAKYQCTLKAIPNSPYFQQVDVGSQIDLATVSQLSGLTMDEVYTLNPGVNHWATDPKGPHHMLIPADKVEKFKENLAALPHDERIQWDMYQIQQGDTLGKIAAQYRCDITALKHANNLTGNTIRVGRSLLIPTSKQPLNQYTLSMDTRRYNGLKRTGDGQQYAYTIKQGDNLWDIGRNYGISVEQLCAWNGISAKTILRPGNKLTVQVNDEQKTGPAIVPVAAHNIATDEQQRVSYTVKEGDTLWLISKRYGVSVAQLQKWNSLKNHRHLQPGQNLDIYIGKPPTDA